MHYPTSILRQLWSAIEATQAKKLLEFSDKELVEQLIAQLQETKSLTQEDFTTMKSYIRSRLPLIRDLALDRHTK
ncbi:MAG: hypothetical protein AAF378_06325 [Cyanobacteria bacterium P01_A01_bin.84]